ncbi:MAG: hypothetical protein JSR66_17695 [Proteobacteria bacterium]|nr:hypothetical protein [Pseudomonadota bacterium]
MEPSNRKVNYRRSLTLYSLEAGCLVGLCGLGYLNLAITLVTIIAVALLPKGSFSTVAERAPEVL